MTLNLIDELLLLALDDKKGTFISDSFSFAYGISGAIMLELILENRIEVCNQKVCVKDKTTTGEKILDDYLELIIQSKKERALKEWIQIFGEKAGRIIKETIEKLIEKGILTKKKEKFLWVFSINNYPARNSELENMLRDRLHDIIMNEQKPKLKEIMLLSLIDSCDLSREVFGKEKSVTYKGKIKAITEDIELTKSVNEAIKEVSDALIALSVIIMSTTTTTTIINN